MPARPANYQGSPRRFAQRITSTGVRRLTRLRKFAISFAWKSLCSKYLQGRARGRIMAIYKLIANGSFGPDEIKMMTEAYEGALIDLDIPDRNDSFTELIAKSIVNVTATGERNPILIKERAIKALGVRRTSAA